MSVAVPPHMIALERANVIRLGGYAALREVRAGSLAISEALYDERAQSLEIGALLQAQWRWGEQRTRRYLDTHFIHPHRRVRQLTDRQRAALATELG